MRRNDWTIPRSSALIPSHRMTPFNRGRSCAATATKSASVAISLMRVVSSFSGGFKGANSFLERALNGLRQEFEAFPHRLRRVRLADDDLKSVLVFEEALYTLCDSGFCGQDLFASLPQAVQLDHSALIEMVCEV